MTVERAQVLFHPGERPDKYDDRNTLGRHGARGKDVSRTIHDHSLPSLHQPSTDRSLGYLDPDSALMPPPRLLPIPKAHRGPRGTLTASGDETDSATSDGACPSGESCISRMRMPAVFQQRSEQNENTFRTRSVAKHQCYRLRQIHQELQT